MRNWVSNQVFKWIHGNHLIYNTCWEDPRCDREALELGADDNVLVITSAGCNTLDYALCAPNHVYAVDMNPRQNALLELKLAGIRALEFDDFFRVFARGHSEDFADLYRRHLRPELGDFARGYWDDHVHWFQPPRQYGGLYFHGTSGYFARLMNHYLDKRPGLRHGVEQLLACETVAEQQELYYGGLRDRFWNPFMRWVAGRDTTLAMVGVPREQRKQVERNYAGGIAEFAEQCLDYVFALLPLGDNYFWRVYLTGQYSEQCCPEYLKRDNFYALKGGLADRISTHTDSVAGFLQKHDAPISRLVLLDHMDWLANAYHEGLRAEWQAIADRAAPDTRVLWRSGGTHVDFVDPVEVAINGERTRVGELLTYHRDWAAALHTRDRVHTYGSFYIADLATA